jgi:hypothetical protein
MTFEPSWEDKAIRGFREGELPFPEVTIIARLAWSYEVIDSMSAFGQPRWLSLRGHAWELHVASSGGRLRRSCFRVWTGPLAVCIEQELQTPDLTQQPGVKTDP